MRTSHRATHGPPAGGVSDGVGSNYRQELVDLRQLLLEMGGLAEECLAAAMDALASPAPEVIARCKSLERETNQLEKTIDERCMRVLAVHQPAASELRFVAMAMKIVTDLERVADLAANVANRAQRVVGLDSMPLPPEIPRLSRAVREMVSAALDAFVERSAEQAVAVLGRDPEVDRLHWTAFERLRELMESDPREVARCMRLIHVIRDLERAGDHAKNIAEGVIFMVRGRDVRHAG